MDFKAIVFDAYGTLFDVNSAAEKCKHKIGDKWEAFANFWRTTQLEYTWLRSLMKRHKDFWQITEDSLDKSMNVFNIHTSMKNELLNLYKVLSPYPEVKEVLTDLKKKNLKLAILSNGTPDLINELVSSNNLDAFDDLFSIEEVKIYKPDSKVYDLPINKYKIQSVLIEGGIKTFKSFLINGAFNEVVICQSSKMINKSKKRYKLDKKLIKNRCKKIDSQEYFRDKIEIYKNV